MFAQQQLNYNNEPCFLRGPCPGSINETGLEFRQLWDICQPVRVLVKAIVKIHYQETTSEDIEDFMCAAVTVIFRVCKPMRLL
jgi:hypothetical protein